MKKLTIPPIYLMIIIFLLFSCRKENKPLVEADDVIFPSTVSEKSEVALIKEVSKILETVYQDPYAYYEVNTAIYSDYYEDERVLLKDLLYPESSPLYKTEKFLSFKAEKGRFAKSFFETMNRGNFPLLRKALKIPLSGNINSRDYTMATTPIDTSIEIFSNSKGVSIYFPYSENFQVPLTTSYFDKVNTPPYITYLATIVAADREADTGPGKEPKKVNSDSLRFIDVTISDSYAELKPTHVIGVGADPKTQRPLNPLSVNVIYIGDFYVMKQYDRLISFSSLNGGGPELRFFRGDGYLQQVNGQTIPQDNLPVNLKRKQCKGGVIRFSGVWDTNWEPANLNQVFAIWEQDASGTQTMSGSLQTTVSNGNGGTTVSSVGYSFSFTSKDPIIRQLKWNRESFFLYNHGGLNGCGVHDGWMMYDCNLGTVCYTMPTQ